MAFAKDSKPTLDDKPTPPAFSAPEREHGDTMLDKPSYGAGRSSPLTSPEALHPGMPRPKREAGGEPHHPTPPITVPYLEDKSHGPTEAGIEYPHSPRIAELSPLEQFARNRRPSISFNPEVRLDTGVYQSIDVPLQNSYERRKVDAKSLLTCSTSQLQALYARANLEDHRDQPWQEDTFPQDDTGQAVARDTGDTHNSIASPVSDSPPDLQHPTSLTSLSTALPPAEEIVTPPDACRGPFSSSDGTLPAVVQAGSPRDADSWPNYGHFSQPPKARSNSVCQLRRPKSRRSTISGGKSPASAFLNMLNTHDAAPEPDDEGQMVGTDYVLGKQIGLGGFSVVKEAFKVKEHGETERFAVKIVRKHFAGKSERENDQVQAEFDHEVRLWRYMDHPHILPLDAVYVTDTATFCFTRMTTGGTLLDLVRRRRGGLKLNEARKYTYQLAQAIRYLHEDARVVHRDIKLENCLLDPAPAPAPITEDDDVSQLILCDFGMAEWMTTEAGGGSSDPYDNAADRPPPKNIGPSDTSTSRAGSLEYASPELLSSDHGVLDPVVDIWAFGVVTFALVVGARPFQHTFQPRVQMNILAGHWDENAVLNGDGDLEDRQDALELIQGCLEMDPVKRWTISEVMSARWLER